MAPSACAASPATSSASSDIFNRFAPSASGSEASASETEAYSTAATNSVTATITSDSGVASSNNAGKGAVGVPLAPAVSAAALLLLRI